MKIGILEDDTAQAKMLSHWLEDEGHAVFIAPSSAEFLKLFKNQPLDLVILDWQLPDFSGIEVVTKLRGSLESPIPVIFSTQRSNEEDIVCALKAGADDYITKPVRQAELLARVSALGRRAGVIDATEQSTICIGSITLDLVKECVFKNGDPVKMTRKDYLVAKHLFQEQGKVLSREYLLKAVWDIEGVDTRTVDVHVSRVRRNLGIGPEMGYVIKTIYQHGYRLEKIET